MKNSTKDIVLSCLAKMTCNFLYKATHATTDKEFEINYANFEKTLKIKENILN